MARYKENVGFSFLSARCVPLVCQVYHAVVPRPKNSPPDCFLNGLSNP